MRSELTARQPAYVAHGRWNRAIATKRARVRYLAIGGQHTATQLVRRCLSRGVANDAAPLPQVAVIELNAQIPVHAIVTWRRVVDAELFGLAATSGGGGGGGAASAAGGGAAAGAGRGGGRRPDGAGDDDDEGAPPEMMVGVTLLRASVALGGDTQVLLLDDADDDDGRAAAMGGGVFGGWEFGRGEPAAAAAAAARVLLKLEALRRVLILSAGGHFA